MPLLPAPRDSDSTSEAACLLAGRAFHLLAHPPLPPRHTRACPSHPTAELALLDRDWRIEAYGADHTPRPMALLASAQPAQRLVTLYEPFLRWLVRELDSPSPEAAATWQRLFHHPDIASEAPKHLAALPQQHRLACLREFALAHELFHLLQSELLSTHEPCPPAQLLELAAEFFAWRWIADPKARTYASPP